MKTVAACLLGSLVASALAVTTVVQPTPQQFYQNDNNVLSVAITAEQFDTNYYRTYLRGAKAFTRQNFISAGFPDPIYTNFLTFLSNEEAHIALLQATLTSRGGPTIPPCTYKYPATNSVNDFIFYSKFFENTGTAAYDGSINAIQNQTLQTAAATIATVEARHAAFLNSIQNVKVASDFALQLANKYGVNITDGPFPKALDLALPADQVFDIITGYIASCPYQIPINPYPAVVIPIGNPSQLVLDANDIKTFNYALTLELLEATFYNIYYPRFSQSAFVAAGYSAIAHTYLGVVTAHENSHVAYYQAILGSQAVVNCTYNFEATGPINSVTKFLQVSALLETTGVSAYDGAVNTIFSPASRQIAATVATVEARHSAYINSLLNGTNFFSAPTDTPYTPTQVVTILKNSGILDVSTCPKVPQIPQVLAVIPQVNSTTSATCNARATVTVRSGSSYVQDIDHYNLYDINIVNTGKCSINTANIVYNTITPISQFWNFVPSTGAVDVFGGIKAGVTSSSSGFIVNVDKAPGFYAGSFVFKFTCDTTSC